jgi:hypothetical protein
MESYFADALGEPPPDGDLAILEALAIEEADAWFEYLEVTRAQVALGRYPEIEPWAWARLNQRLKAVRRKRARLNPAAA